MAETRMSKNWINGRWLDAESKKRLANRSPVDPDVVIHEFPDSGPDDMVAAIDAAADAFDDWSNKPAPHRGAILFKAASVLEGRKEEASQAMAREMGKPITEARGEVARSVDLFRYYGGWGWNLAGDRFPSATEENVIYTIPVPLGVVSLITPWNFPSAIPVWKMAPALVTGNTVILKPASQAPASSIIIAECLAEAGLPAGVLNLVCGRGSACTEPMLTDERIKAVSFTGSCKTGERIFQQAASPRRRVGLEMGGKNPLLVPDGGSLDEAVNLAVAGAMASAGQKCTATSRVIVAKDLAGDFTDRLVAKVESLKTGDPLEEDTDVGPVIDNAALEQILGYIDTGKKEGAKLLTGGKRLTTHPLDKGSYCAPTVFSGVTGKMTIATEEIFGPVLAVMEAGSFDEMIDIANDVSYGLSAAICTRDIGLAREFTNRVQVGLVHVNSTTSGAEVQVPFGGTRASSSGFKEMGKGGIDFFTSVKTVYYR